MIGLGVQVLGLGILVQAGFCGVAAQRTKHPRQTDASLCRRENRRRQEVTVVSIEVEVRSRVLLAVLGLTPHRDWWGYARQNQAEDGSPEPCARVYMMGKLAKQGHIVRDQCRVKNAVSYRPCVVEPFSVV